jgi:fatty-acid desaturase
LSSLKYAFFLTFLGFLDQLTTWIAVNRGARELNPLIAPTLSDPLAFALASMAKCGLIFAVSVLPSYEKGWQKALYWIVVLAFLQAIAFNLVNAFMK